MWACVHGLCVCTRMCVCLHVQLLSCVRLCDPMDCSLSGSSLHGILQARIMEWAATSFSRGSSWPGMEPASPTLAGRFFITASPGKSYTCVHIDPYTYVYIEPYTYVLIQLSSVYIQSLLRKSKEPQGSNSTTTECLPRVLQSISTNHKIYFVRNYYYPHLTNE